MNFEEAKKLIDEKSVRLSRVANSMSRDDKNLLYLYSVEKGYLDGVEILCGKGIDENCQMPDGNTSLHIAVSNGDIEMVQTLLNVLKCDFTITNSDDYTAFELAEQMENKDILIEFSNAIMKSDLREKSDDSKDKDGHKDFIKVSKDLEKVSKDAKDFMSGTRKLTVLNAYDTGTKVYKLFRDVGPSISSISSSAKEFKSFIGIRKKPEDKQEDKKGLEIGI